MKNTGGRYLPAACAFLESRKRLLTDCTKKKLKFERNYNKWESVIVRVSMKSTILQGPFTNCTQICCYPLNKLKLGVYNG